MNAEFYEGHVVENKFEEKEMYARTAQYLSAHFLPHFDECFALPKDRLGVRRVKVILLFRAYLLQLPPTCIRRPPPLDEWDIEEDGEEETGGGRRFNVFELPLEKSVCEVWAACPTVSS